MFVWATFQLQRNEVSLFIIRIWNTWWRVGIEWI